MRIRGMARLRYAESSAEFAPQIAAAAEHVDDVAPSIGWNVRTFSPISTRG
jgi:hypothetical protein